MVNSVPEELIYISLGTILIDYSRTPQADTLEVAIKSIQVRTILHITFQPGPHSRESLKKEIKIIAVI